MPRSLSPIVNLAAILALSVLLLGTSLCQPLPSDTPVALVRCDDIGMCHTVNLALMKVLDAGIPVSTSVMFGCPWYQEAVEILKNHPQVSVGVHLTLNAEWKNYRWGPVVGWQAVPSLTDSLGLFFPSRDSFFRHNPKVEEVERELRAQIDRAMNSGLTIDYLDYHMGTAVDTPELRALVERLARDYHLGISRYFGEVDVSGVYGAPIEHKADTLMERLRTLQPGPPRLMVFHIGLESPEMDALVDFNSFGLANVSKHRASELNALTSPDFMRTVKEKKIHLVRYRDLIQSTGLENMRRPEP